MPSHWLPQNCLPKWSKWFKDSPQKVRLMRAPGEARVMVKTTLLLDQPSKGIHWGLSVLWQCPRLKWMPLTLHIFEPFSHAFLLLLKVVRNCTAWAKVLGGLPRIPAKKALPLFLRRMQSSRSLKGGNKSSSPGREMKDKTKRIKCFGCEHISFHFLLLGTNNSLSFWGVQIDIYTKMYLRYLQCPWQSKGTPIVPDHHLPKFLVHQTDGWGCCHL